MLVLSRKSQEKVRIVVPGGPTIWVQLVEICDGRKVRLGIEAPREVEIHREEVAKLIDAAKRRGEGKPDVPDKAA